MAKGRFLVFWYSTHGKGYYEKWFSNEDTAVRFAKEKKKLKTVWSVTVADMLFVRAGMGGYVYTWTDGRMAMKHGGTWVG